MNEWISIEDRLPEPGERVIVACYGSDIFVVHEGETLEEVMERSRKHAIVKIGFIGSDGWCEDDYFPMIIKPKFWQPLPEPPKGEDK